MDTTKWTQGANSTWEQQGFHWKRNTIKPQDMSWQRAKCLSFWNTCRRNPCKCTYEKWYVFLRTLCGFILVGDIIVDTSNPSNICTHNFSGIIGYDFNYTAPVTSRQLLQSNYTLVKDLLPTSTGINQFVSFGGEEKTIWRNVWWSSDVPMNLAVLRILVVSIIAFNKSFRCVHNELVSIVAGRTLSYHVFPQSLLLKLTPLIPAQGSHLTCSEDGCPESCGWDSPFQGFTGSESSSSVNCAPSIKALLRRNCERPLAAPLEKVLFLLPPMQ